MAATRNWAVLLLLGCVARLAVVALEVEVSIEAAWQAAPLAAELLEGLAKVGQGPDYLRALGKQANEVTTASAWRRVAARVAEELLTAGNSSTVFSKFLSVSARYSTATTGVEAARGLERAQAPASSCPRGTPWAVLARPGFSVPEAICGAALARLPSLVAESAVSTQPAAEEESGEQLPRPGPRPARSTLDHVLYEDGASDGEADSPELTVVVGYGDLGSPGASAVLLSALLGVAELLEQNGRPGWVAFRHGAGDENSTLAAAQKPLLGYGVELLARSADEVTKSVDEEAQTSPLSEENGTASCSWTSGTFDAAGRSGGADLSEIFHGVDLAVLAQRHPEAEKALCAFRGDLRTAAETPPPPWELRRLGARAVLRATKELGGGLAGLSGIGEVAQDFPSGWARALITGGAKGEQDARLLMEEAIEMQGALGLEVNGWLVPSAKSGLLPLLHVHAPLMRAVELLSRQGFKENSVAQLLRDSRPRAPPATRFATADPRLHQKSDGAVSNAFVLFDARTDPSTEDWRQQSGQQPLLQLLQMYGRYWQYPTPTPRALLGIGLWLNPCVREHLTFLNSLLQKPVPSVVWLHLATKESQSQKVLALLKDALAKLLAGSPGPSAARSFLQNFEKGSDGPNICAEGSEERVKKVFNEVWKQTGEFPEGAPKLSSKGDKKASRSSQPVADFPAPSATVNGKLLSENVVLLPGVLEKLCRQEFERSLNKIGRDLGVEAEDASIAAMQYGQTSMELAHAGVVPPLLRAWHPALSSGGRGAVPRYAIIEPEHLRGLPGGWASQQAAVTSNATVLSHILVLGDPACDTFTSRFFMIKLDKTAGAKIGMHFTSQDEGKTFSITSIKNTGLIFAWNAMNPKKTVNVGDRILHVNGEKNGSLFLQELKKNQTVEITLKRRKKPLEETSDDQGAGEAEDEEGGPLAGPAALLEAYAEHFQEVMDPTSSEGSPSRWLSVAVTGGCSTKATATLGLAGSMRRCLNAAIQQSSSPSDVVGALLGVARAWRSASEAVGDALQNGETGSAGIAQAVLEACASASKPSKSLNVRWADPERLRPATLEASSDDTALCTAQRVALRLIGHVPPGAAFAILNGRRHGPLFAMQSGVRFAAQHLALVEGYELDHPHLLHGPSAEIGVVGTLHAARPAVDDPHLLPYALSVLARAMDEAQLAKRGADDGDGQSKGDGSMDRSKGDGPADFRLHIPPVADIPCLFQVFAAFDPLSVDAQKLPPLLRFLHEEFNAEIGVLLRPQPLAALPLQGYYRAALAPSAPVGGLAALADALEVPFSGVRFALPSRRGLLLSVKLHTPEAWHCSSVDSEGADLDSLAADSSGVVRARYALEALFVEGWAGTGQSPAAGRQLALVSLGQEAGDSAGKDSVGSNSVVVKSGYFQLRAPPGLYRLALRSAGAEQLSHPTGAIELVELVGRGAQLQARVVVHRPSQNDEGAAAAKDDQSEKGWLPAWLSFGGGKEKKADENIDSAAVAAYDGGGGNRSLCNSTIHIFSVASGLRYERLLRIMMLSVREHTSCPLRFWLVDNFLSPSFRRMLPMLEKQVGIAVSRVTYKWPAWLREQTQKQRVIWAYKILFLDVLFPMQIRRVLFIDADQIVRSDVRELWDINLRNHVYGFVPFCHGGDVNLETKGHRFWEQGFWASHLGQRHYHISALFVVDLAKFRDTGAGDALRQIYQELTGDPNSLANLDQDLPNYAQHQLSIFSLPQEWLWCETWCSEGTKTKAKTIDMCQNPVRKEGKLQQARRIAPEWTKYDARLEAWIKDV